MKTVMNVAKAHSLLDLQPVGRVTPAIFIPWATRVLCFLLNRYLKED